MKIKGLAIYPGKGKGKVKKIVSVCDFNRVDDGDVVVTKNATPDFIVILDRISCLLTDEGGITSHIAIICRELKIPAIVGMKFATEKLKDGSIINYDSKNGFVITRG